MLNDKLTSPLGELLLAAAKEGATPLGRERFDRLMQTLIQDLRGGRPVDDRVHFAAMLGHAWLVSAERPKVKASLFATAASLAGKLGAEEVALELFEQALAMHPSRARKADVIAARSAIARRRKAERGAA